MLLARFFQLLLNEIDDVSDITIILPAIKSHTLQDTLDMFFTDYYVVIYCQGTNNIALFQPHPKVDVEKVFPLGSHDDMKH